MPDRVLLVRLRLGLFVDHYRVARRYAGRLGALRVAWLFAWRSKLYRRRPGRV